ncbi:MAG: hypothetical protein KGY38_08095 [Desulfobacterales bacterium]|nr:hypothetical protein [Desulfobacterales bacterium]
MQDPNHIKVPGFSNHNRRAKRRMPAIMNGKNKKQRKAADIDRLKGTEKGLGYARGALERLIGASPVDKSLCPACSG